MKKLVQYSVLSTSRNREEHFARFFSQFKKGDRFAYSGAFNFSEIQKMAADHGLKVKSLNCSETNGEFAVEVQHRLRDLVAP